MRRNWNWKPLKRQYALFDQAGWKTRTFYSLSTAWRTLRKDCPDLTPSDLIEKTGERPLRFADGYVFFRVA